MPNTQGLGNLIIHYLPTGGSKNLVQASYNGQTNTQAAALIAAAYAAGTVIRIEYYYAG